jgi:hypothetical protein
MSRQTLLAAALALAAAGQAQAQQPQIDADRKRPVPDYYLTITSTTDPRIRCRILDAGMPATQADLATWHIVLYYGTTNGLGLAITNTASGNGYAEWSATKAQTATTGVFASQVVAYHRTDGRVQEWARGKACFLQNPAAAYIPFTWSTSNGWVTMAQFAAEQTARSAGDAGLTQHVSAVVGASGTVWRAEWTALTTNEAALRLAGDVAGSNYAATVAASTAGATNAAHVAASDPHGDRAYSATLLSTGTAAVALSAPWSGLTGTPPKLNAATNADWATAAGTATDATARASATDAYTNAEARLPLSWTNGPVGIDAEHAKTNVYGGMVVKLGPRVQQGTGNASGEYSFAGQGSTASGEGAWAMYGSTASDIGSWAMYYSTASGEGSWAMYGSTASGDGAWAMDGSIASGLGSWAMLNSTASGIGSWANYYGAASGAGSWAMLNSTASGDGAWANYFSTASGEGSWAMRDSTASGNGSWAMFNSTAAGYGSWAMDGANATNDHAFAWRANSHGDGTFNIGPDGGADGFYIGETNLSWFLTHATDPNAVTAVWTNGIPGPGCTLVTSTNVIVTGATTFYLATNTATTWNLSVSATASQYCYTVRTAATNLPALVGSLFWENTNEWSCASTAARYVLIPETGSVYRVRGGNAW